MAEQPFKIQAQIDVTCFTIEGIRAIKQALGAGKTFAEEKNVNLEIALLSTPTYRLLIQTTDKQQGMDLVTEAMKIIEDAIKQSKGNFGIKEKPKEV